MNEYSSLKPAWHTAQIDALRHAQCPIPKHVHLVISDLCNHDCHFCAYRNSNGFSSEQFGEVVDGTVNRNPNRMIPEAKVLGILDDCAAIGVKAVQFTGGGEPTVHPHHLELLDYALGLGLEVSLVTNGALLRKDWQEVLPRLSWLRVSVDAGSSGVYARVRNVSMNAYRKTLANMAEIATELKARSSACVFGAGYVVTRENWENIVDGVRAIRQTGVHYVRLTAMFSKEYLSYYDGIEDAIRAEIAMAKTLAEPGFEVIDLYGTRISDMAQAAPDYIQCGYQHFTTFVGANQKVYRCCNTAYTARGEVGDLHSQRFGDFLRSSDRDPAYLTFDARTCGVCQFNGQNRVINYLTDQAPTHVNFV